MPAPAPAPGPAVRWVPAAAPASIVVPLTSDELEHDSDGHGTSFSSKIDEVDVKVIVQQEGGLHRAESVEHVHIEPARHSMVREATRRLKGSGFDHGRSYLTFEDITFKIKVNEKSSEIATVGNAFAGWRSAEREVAILDGVSGYLAPGTTTLLLGGPRSGKSTLMRILAHQTQDLSKGKLSGRVLLNGAPSSDAFHRQVTLVEQSDDHYPLLTVRETLEFAARLRAAREMSQEDVSERVNLILGFLRLQHAADTIVGDQVIRGISGGEKRRLTVGLEHTATGGSVMLMDQASDGLDATATLELCRVARTIADEGVAVFACLLQPSWEAFCCFDSLLVLAAGRTAYFGPAQAAVGYFESQGYKRQSGMTPQDFLQWVTEKPGEALYQGPGPAPTPLQLAERFAQSKEAARAKEGLCSALEAGRALPAPPAPLHGRYAQPFRTQFWLNYVRFTKLLIRNPGPNLGRFVSQMVIMAFVLGTLFAQMPPTARGAMNRVAFLQASALGFGFVALSKLDRYFRDRAMLYKESADRYYHPLAWFLAIVLADVPRLFLEVLVFSSITYFAGGLQMVGHGYRFGRFILALFAMTLASDSIILMIAAWSPYISIGAIAGAITPPVLLMFNGFLVPKGEIPDAWIWMHYLSVYRYPHEALCINELLDLELRDDPAGGARLLEQFNMHKEAAWYWYCVLITLGFWLGLLTLAALGLTHKRWRKLWLPPKDPSGPSTEVRLDGADQGVSFRPPRALVTFKDLSYSVAVKKGHKTLLDKVTGYCKSGDLVALMGQSGGGKTTLLDVLADRKTGGKTTGELLINKKPRDKFFLRASGYVEQFDTIFPTMTVREAVITSALLRLDSAMSHLEKVQAADAVIDVLHLRPHAGEMIGTQAAGGLSFSMRKRVSIAMELVTRPSLLFLDEPTSGLDAASAMQIVKLLKELASRGQAILCTIHQPSAEIFATFDKLLLLKKGGEVTYFGPMHEGGVRCGGVLGYFRDRLGFPFPAHRNPADYVLDVVMGRVPRDPAAAAADADKAADKAAEDFDFAGMWAASPLAERARRELDEANAGFDTEDPHFSGVYAAPLRRQIAVLLRRKALDVWRDPLFFYSKLFSNVFIGFIIGTMWARMGDSQVEARMRTSLVFLWTMYFMARAMGDVPTYFAARDVYYRERSQGMFQPLAHQVANFLVAAPIAVLNLLVFMVLTYWIPGMNDGDRGLRFAFALFAVWEWQLFAVTFAEFVAYAVPNPMAAQAIQGLFMSLGSYFAGFMIPSNDMPRPWIWLYYLLDFHYPLESLIGNEMRGLTFSGCPPQAAAAGLCFSTGDDVVASFGFDYDHVGTNLIWLALFYVFFELMKCLVQHRVVHLTR